MLVVRHYCSTASSFPATIPLLVSHLSCPLCTSSLHVTCSALQRGLRDVLASSRLRRRLVLLAAAWFAAGAGYFGLMLLADGLSSGSGSSSGSGGGTAGKGGSTAGDDSVYINLLSGFAYEVPGIAAAGLAVERAGRKATGVAAFLQGLCAGWVGWQCKCRRCSSSAAL